MKSTKRSLAMFGWFLCALGAFNWGLDELGYNLFHFNLFQTTLAGLVPFLKYAIGAAGAYSLALFAQSMATGKMTCPCP